MDMNEAITTIKNALPKGAFIEDKKKTYIFKPVKNPSLDQGDKFNTSTNWKSAANSYYAVFTSSVNVDEKSKALCQTAQMLINLGYYEQALNILNANKNKVLRELKDKTSIKWFLLKLEEKKAWIADYRFQPKKEIEYLKVCLALLKGLKDKTQQFTDTNISIRHFLGRAYIYAALQSPEKKVNITKARACFKYCINKLSETKTKYPPSEAYQNYWLSITYILEGKLNIASNYLDKTYKLWESFYSDEQSSNVFGHYYIMQGIIELKTKNISKAKIHFQAALSILKKHPYIKSEAEAYAGLAICNMIADRKILALKQATKAVKLYPNVFIKSLF